MTFQKKESLRVDVKGERAELALSSGSAEDTLEIGRLIGTELCEGDVVALMGELGAGKTCLTGGIAKGIGVSKNYYITSPTFTIINEYPGELPLYHFDVYRLSTSNDLKDLGYEDYFRGEGVTVIEWAERIRDVLPKDAFIISLEHGGETLRGITISGGSEKMERIAEKLKGGGFS